MAEKLIGGIDAGGTTFKLAVAAPDGRLLGETKVPTTTPDDTIRAAGEAMTAMAASAGGRIGRLGIASFGPVDVDPASPGYGTLLSTPKPGWSGAPLLTALEDRLGVPGALDTDVNGALEAEAAWGALSGLDRVAYVTVGTGIGVGVRTDGVFAGRPFHPELGHVRVARHADDADYEGRCPFHEDCLEGLAAAPALIDRFGPLESLSPDAEAWEVPAHYLAQLCLTLVLGFRTEGIVLGGGVLNAPTLLARTRSAFAALMNGYVTTDPRRAILRAGLGDRAGVLGGCLIANRAGGEARARP